MSEQLLNVLKLLLLALVYLFLFRVVRAVWVEIAPPRPVEAGPRRPRRAAAAAAVPVSTKSRRLKGTPTELVTIEPADQAGRRYPLGDEITLGRAAGCQIAVEDNFVSQLHARVFRRDGQVLVEDLGSTNGTYLNRAKVAGPMAMHRGDRLQVGNTVLEVA